MANVDYDTEVQSARDIIRAFLDLPAEAMPSAVHLHAEPMTADPWAAIRDYMLPDDAREYSHAGDEIRLRADRDGWRDGVNVQLV